MIPFSWVDGALGSVIRAGVNAAFARIFRREYFPTIANNGTDAAHDLDIGAARLFVEDGSGNSAFVEFDAETIAIDGAGLDTGSVANNTWYYVWAFWNPTTGDSLYKLSASTTAPTAPSGYTYKRFLCDEVAAAVRTDGSANILAGRWTKKQFDFNATIADVVTSTPVTTTPPPLVSVTVPNLLIKWRGVPTISGTGTVAGMFIALYDQPNSQRKYIGRAQTASIAASEGFIASITADGGQIRYNASAGSGAITEARITTHGYEVF